MKYRPDSFDKDILILTCRSKRLHYLLVIIFLFLFFYFQFSDFLRLFQIPKCKDKTKPQQISPIEVFETFNKNAPIFITALCQGDNIIDKDNELSSSIKRQIDQTVTMIKSAVVLSTSFVNFILVVDHDSIYKKVIEEIEQFPKDILKKISLQKRPTNFPDEKYKALFKICAPARLFFPDQMTDIDSAIYVDTDTLFMRPPEELWAEFKLFNSDQISGLVDMDFFYQPDNKIPYYRQGNGGGLNAGLWMMNMTRMRGIPGGWTKTCLRTYEEYKQDLILPDQDIANIIFNKTQKYLYLIGCRWNSRSWNCMSGVNVCEESRRIGMYSLHGCDMKFFKDDFKYMAMYNVWKDFQPDLPLTDLLNTFHTSLKKVDTMTPLKLCSLVKGIDFDLTKGLEDHINTIK